MSICETLISWASFFWLTPCPSLNPIIQWHVSPPNWPQTSTWIVLPFRTSQPFMIPHLSLHLCHPSLYPFGYKLSPLPSQSINHLLSKVIMPFWEPNIHFWEKFHTKSIIHIQILHPPLMEVWAFWVYIPSQRRIQRSRIPFGRAYRWLIFPIRVSFVYHYMLE